MFIETRSIIKTHSEKVGLDKKTLVHLIILTERVSFWKIVEDNKIDTWLGKDPLKTELFLKTMIKNIKRCPYIRIYLLKDIRNNSGYWHNNNLRTFLKK
jgi:hypothetical protein